MQTQNDILFCIWAENVHNKTLLIRFYYTQ